MAERNFDEEFDLGSRQGHTFTLGGHTFQTLAVAPPGAFLDMGSGLRAAVRFLRRVVVPEHRPMLERILETQDVSGRLLDFAPELYEASAKVLGASDNPEERTKAEQVLSEVVNRIDEGEESLGVTVSAHQVIAAFDWLVGETIGRPTNSPSSSSGGGERTSNGSKATSSKAAKASRN